MSEETILYTTQLHTFHQDLHLTPPCYPYIHFTTQPALIPFPSLHLADLHPTSNSLHFTPLIKFQPHYWKYLISSILQIPFTSLHLALTLHSPCMYLIFPHFKIPSPYFTYVISAPVPGNTRFPPHFKFPSLHFTSPSS